VSAQGNREWGEVRAEILADDPELRKLTEAGEPAFQVAKELIRIRAERGLSQSEVARRMKTSASVISRLEKMESRPTLATVYALAKALGCEVEIRFIDQDELVDTSAASARVDRSTILLGTRIAQMLREIVEATQRV
jgi:transcriptional regulator with XRE-family HTH domain